MNLDDVPQERLLELRQELLTRQRLAARRSNYVEYRPDPAAFVENILGETLWSKQREIIEAVRDYPAVAVPSCFGAGKSWIAARVVAWWVSTGGIAITTADTYRQVRDILWRELREAHRKGNLPGHIPQVECRWETGKKSAWAIGIKPDDTNQEGFQGIHGSRVLTVYDEANGIPPALWEAGRGLATGEFDRRLAIGNPNEPQGPFYEACRSRTWHVIHLSAFDTPNFTGEVIPPEMAEKLVSPRWVQTLRDDNLEGTPFWQAKVLGEFPENASNVVIPLTWIERARHIPYIGDARDAAGLDVARFGVDDSVLMEGGGNGPESMLVMHGHDLMTVAGFTSRWLLQRRGHVAIDIIGVGSGVYDRLNELRLPGHLLGVNVGSSPDDGGLFVNLRAQLWWKAREAFQREEISLERLDEANYQRLKAELSAVTYRPTSAGKIQIEAKEELKARGVGSPDAADAFVLWLYARHRKTRRTGVFAAVA